MRLPAPPPIVPIVPITRTEIEATIEERPAIEVRPVVWLGIDCHHTWPHRTSRKVEVGRDHVTDASLPIRRAPLTRTSADFDDAAARNHGDHPKGRPRSLPQIGVGS